MLWPASWPSIGWPVAFWEMAPHVLQTGQSRMLLGVLSRSAANAVRMIEMFGAERCSQPNEHLGTAE